MRAGTSSPVGLRLMAMPPGASRFALTAELPIIAINLADMLSRVGFDGARRDRVVERAAVCWLPAGVAFGIESDSRAWSLLIELDPAAIRSCDVERVVDPVTFVVDAAAGRSAAAAIAELTSSEPARHRTEELGHRILERSLALAGLAEAGPPRFSRPNWRIMADLAAVPSVDDIAAAPGLGASHFSRLFKAAAEHPASGPSIAAFAFDGEVPADSSPRVRRPTVLALSGGGPDGAFGAGYIAGEAQTGEPPADVVTGVNTGALIAPFAFVGAGPALRNVLSGPTLDALPPDWPAPTL